MILGWVFAYRKSSKVANEPLGLTDSCWFFLAGLNWPMNYWLISLSKTFEPKTSHARVERPFEVNILQGQAVGSLGVNLLSDLYWEDHHSQPQFHALVMAGRWLPGWWYSLSISIKPPILKPTDSPRGPVPNCAIYPHPSHPIHTFTPPQFLAQEITAENNQEIGCVCEKRRYKESKICWMVMVDGFFVIFVEPQQKTTHATGHNIWTKTGFTVQAFGRSFEKIHGWDLSFPLYCYYFLLCFGEWCNQYVYCFCRGCRMRMLYFIQCI